MAILAHFRTSERENCHQLERVAVRGPNWPFNGVDALVPPHAIVTLTSLA
jgi:hypothetical protein